MNCQNQQFLFVNSIHVSIFVAIKQKEILLPNLLSLCDQQKSATRIMWIEFTSKWISNLWFDSSTWWEMGEFTQICTWIKAISSLWTSCRCSKAGHKLSYAAVKLYSSNSQDSFKQVSKVFVSCLCNTPAKNALHKIFQSPQAYLWKALKLCRCCNLERNI
jgi:hypothetical protein